VVNIKEIGAMPKKALENGQSVLIFSINWAKNRYSRGKTEGRRPGRKAAPKF
jgi:hypothetical protein